MCAYQCDNTFLVMNIEKDSIIFNPLSFPTYSEEEKQIIYEEACGGLIDFDEKTKTFSIYSKGVGWGGLSTKSILKFKDGRLILMEQKGTKDLKDKNYPFPTDGDWWYNQYEREDKSGN